MAYNKSKFGDITSQPSFKVGHFSVTTTASTMDAADLNWRSSESRRLC